ncbi:hypothetical protein KSP40_PGU015244 [Platanthera guangdongensis]|uniref:Uncharacterized protein n=1 Tax=Platanthera guangdongensis TaxID=2320717 RepID=A0ABR2LGW9_9ASPA
MTEDHNKSIVGNGTVWYEMSYEDTIKQRMARAHAKSMPEETEAEEEDDEEEDDLDFDYSILGNFGDSEKPLVNGTESPRMSNEGVFED